MQSVHCSESNSSAHKFAVINLVICILQFMHFELPAEVEAIREFPKDVEMLSDENG